MAPNLFLAIKTAFQPHEWFRRKDECKQSDLSLIQHRDDPVPGIYKHIPGCGWFLIATKPSANSAIHTVNTISPPRPVVYSKVLKCFLFESDFVARTRQARILGEPKWIGKSGFFRLDDGMSWVNCWDHEGGFRKGPWQRYCWDADEEKFRPMLVGDKRHSVDDEEWIAARKAKARAKASGHVSRPSASRTPSSTKSVEKVGEGHTSSNSSRYGSTCGDSLEVSENYVRRGSGCLVDGEGNLNVECASLRCKDVSSSAGSSKASLHVTSVGSSSRSSTKSRSCVSRQDFAADPPTDKGLVQKEA